MSQAQDAAALKARHAGLREVLANNQFQRPLVLESSEASGALKGEVYAEVGQAFAVTGAALSNIDAWCDILILHLNVKGCRASERTLSLSVGRKFDQPLADAYAVDFSFSAVTSTTDYLRVELTAAKGPMGTRDYRIVLEAAPLDAQRSFLHMSYSYAYGMAARLALSGYLATAGSHKVGFSIVGRDADGKPRYIDGVRGVIERNTMRYYLAIEAYLGALSTPADSQVEKRLNDWYASVERYPVQLHELKRDEYLGMKRKEIQRQATTPVAMAP